MHNVPSMSQLVNGSGGDRCGETCLAACLSSFGFKVSMSDVTNYFIQKKFITDFNHGQSYIGQLLDGAIHYGVHAQVLNNEKDMRDALSANKAVIVLLYNGLLHPLPYPNSAGWLANHYVVVQDIKGGSASIMDPLAYPGPNLTNVTEESLIAAIHNVPIQQWGLSLWGNADVSKPPAPPPGPKKIC